MLSGLGSSQRATDQESITTYAARHAAAEVLSHETFCEYCGCIARTHTSRGKSAGMLRQFSTAIVRIVGHFLSRHNL